MLEIISRNLLSPAVLFFVLGVLAAVVKSDLKIPASLKETLSIYLLIAIGLKGGIAFSEQPLDQLVRPIIGALFLGSIIPVITFVICRKMKMDNKNALALSATYGSVSIVTFAAAISFLGMVNQSYESFMTALVVLLESPAIIVSLFMLHVFETNKNNQGIRTNEVHGIVSGNMSLFSTLFNAHVIKESFFGKSVLLMMGSLVIGMVIGKNAMPIVKPLFIDLYPSVLIIFLLSMGIMAGERIREIKEYGFKLMVLGMTFPLLFGVLGVIVGKLCGLSLGGTFLMGILSASSSYIAAPAAIKTSIPEANPSIYLGLSLGITFPFNLAVGLPLIYQLTQWVY